MNWSDTLHVLILTESDLEVEEVKASWSSQSIWEGCQERMDNPKEKCCENKFSEDGEVGGSKG